MHQETHVYNPITPPVHLDLVSSKPLDAANPQPAVVYFHGGGLTSGSRRLRASAVLPQVLLAEGWAIVSADYRLLPESNVPEILEDLQELENWLLKCQLGIDVSRLTVAGSSAGAFISLLAITSWQTLKPRAFFSQYGMVNTAGEWYSFQREDNALFSGIPASLLLKDNFAHHFQPGRPQVSADDGEMMAPDSRAALFLWLLKEGRIGNLLKQSMRAATGFESPLELIKPSFPPTVLVHGTADTIIPFGDAQALEAVLQQANVPVRLIGADGAEHGMLPQEKYRSIFNEALRFLKEHSRL